MSVNFPFAITVAPHTIHGMPSEFAEMCANAVCVCMAAYVYVCILYMCVYVRMYVC